ncbi:MAG: energy transducer TonB [Pyrinomonadaceae bacterium]
MKLQVSAIRISFLVLFLCLNLSAQNMTGETGFTEAKVLSVPNPEFPAAARESGLGGRISVYVRIDESGNIVSVDDPTGPHDVCPSVTRADVVALRDAARTAAVKATFSPAISNGKPIASAVRLDFDFPETARKAGKTDNVVGHSPPADYSDKYTVKGDRNFNVAAADSTQGNEPNKAPFVGIINNAKILPKPIYPAAARAVRASGAVSIKVLIDTDGTVFTAVAVSGHPLLRSAAKIAACNAVFVPMHLSDVPVKVSGIINYNFGP